MASFKAAALGKSRRAKRVDCVEQGIEMRNDAVGADLGGGRLGVAEIDKNHFVAAARAVRTSVSELPTITAALARPPTARIVSNSGRGSGLGRQTYPVRR